MPFSQNQKIFSEYFSAFPKSGINLEYFAQIDEPRKLFVSEITGCKKRGYLNAEEGPARILMDSQHVKVSERLLKSARLYFCHIF